MKRSGRHHDALAGRGSNVKNPQRTLIEAFAVWKLFLFAISAGSYAAGDAYDTSGSLAVLGGSNDNNITNTNQLGLVGKSLTARLASWDAVYFVSIARRGYRFEQEWAFGSALPLVIRGIVRGR